MKYIFETSLKNVNSITQIDLTFFVAITEYDTLILVRFYYIKYE